MMNTPIDTWAKAIHGRNTNVQSMYFKMLMLLLIKYIQFKTVRFYFSPVRLAEIQKNDDTQC